MPFFSIGGMVFDFIINICILYTMKLEKEKEKNSKVEPNNALMKRGKVFANRILALFQWEKKQPILLLPESIRYSLSHQNWYIGQEELENLLHTSAYQSIWLYLTTRFLKPTGYKNEFLEEICTYLYSGSQYSYSEINTICLSYMHLRKVDSMQIHKLWYISRRWFDIDTYFMEAFWKSPIEENTIPIIALYAGILWLPVLSKLYPNKPVVFYDIKTDERIWYNFPENPWKCSTITWEMLANYDKVAFIDDAIQSWQTLEKCMKTIPAFIWKDIEIQPIIAMKWFSS